MAVTVRRNHIFRLTSTGAVDHSRLVDDVVGISDVRAYARQIVRTDTVGIDDVEVVENSGSDTWFGYEKPGPTNTGSTGGTLTAQTAAQIEASMSNNAVIQNVAISGGTVDLGSWNNVTIRNFTHDAVGDLYAFRTNGTGTGLHLEDGEIWGMDSAAVLGPGFTALRLNVHDGQGDGFKPQNAGSGSGPVVIESCWVHVLGLAVDAHGDGLQIGGGGNTHTVSVIGCNFDLPRGLAGSVHTSCVMLDPGSGPGVILIQHNWLNGGQATIYAEEVPNSVDVIENRFGRDYGSTILSDGPCRTWSGNVWDDTGAALPSP